MKIIISPAKKMKSECAYEVQMSTPVFIQEAHQLHSHMKAMTCVQLQSVLQCNAAIAQQNFERYQSLDVHQHTNPAILSYDGIQYKYMAPHIFEDSYMAYVNERVRILSGLYGVLKPMDGVISYRLEMQAKPAMSDCKTMYAYWKDRLYQDIVQNDTQILNLASHEYSKCIEAYLTKDVVYVTCIFGELVDGKVKEKGVYVKMARGEMVRYMAEHNIQEIEEIKAFDRMGFRYQEDLSNQNTFVYIR